jgi:putative endonuclease
MFYIYVLYSKATQRYYVGSTEKVEKRIQEHNSGKSKSTRAGTPWELIYTECFETRSKAMQQEKRIKSRGVGRYLADIQKKEIG